MSTRRKLIEKNFFSKNIQKNCEKYNAKFLSRRLLLPNCMKRKSLRHVTNNVALLDPFARVEREESGAAVVNIYKKKRKNLMVADSANLPHLFDLARAELINLLPPFCSGSTTWSTPKFSRCRVCSSSESRRSGIVAALAELKCYAACS